MHGWCGGEGSGGRRQHLVRPLWPATHVEAKAPPSPAQGPTTSPSRSSVLPHRTTSYLLATAAAREQEGVDSPCPVSPGSFIKVRLCWESLWNSLGNLDEI
jgi:hypothetical protein